MSQPDGQAQHGIDPRTPRLYRSLLGFCRVDILWEMTLQIDTGKALRRQAVLVALIRAVCAASEHDETLAIEWKSELDLTSKAGQFTVARAILGLANRAPDRAASMFEGYGYIVVGASSGTLPGITSVDPARYVPGINDYVGDARGPAWTARHVDVDGVTVAVIEVDPPQSGDQIWPLRKEFTAAPERDQGKPGGVRGAVFVRKPGRTGLATDDDIDMLSTRAAGSTEIRPDINIDVVGDLPIPWLESEATSEPVRGWVDSLADAMLEQAAVLERRRHEPDDNERRITPLEAAKFGVDVSAIRRLAASLGQTGDRLLASRPPTPERSMTSARTWSAGDLGPSPSRASRCGTCTHRTGTVPSRSP